MQGGIGGLGRQLRGADGDCEKGGEEAGVGFRATWVEIGPYLRSIRSADLRDFEAKKLPELVNPVAEAADSDRAVMGRAP